MKITISELSKKLSVTPQAIYKKVNKQLKQQLNGHLYKGEKGETLIDEEGQDILKNSFKLSCETVKQPSSTTEYELFKEQLTIKDTQINTLTNELIKANEHIREMSLTLAELNRNNQVLLKQAQDRIAISAPREDTPKEGIFKKLFKRKST